MYKNAITLTAIATTLIGCGGTSPSTNTPVDTPPAGWWILTHGLPEMQRSDTVVHTFAHVEHHGNTVLTTYDRTDEDGDGVVDCDITTTFTVEPTDDVFVSQTHLGTMDIQYEEGNDMVVTITFVTPNTPTVEYFTFLGEHIFDNHVQQYLSDFDEVPDCG